MNRQPVLENPRFRIEPLAESHRQALFEVASDPLIWDQHPAKERATRQGFDRFFEQSIDSGGGLVIIDKTSEKVIGSSRYELHEQDQHAVQIGWTFFARAYWGTGTNEQIKLLMIDHAFLYMDRILLYIDHKNYQSQAAVRKIGATQISKEEYPVVFRDRPDYTTFVIEKE